MTNNNKKIRDYENNSGELKLLNIKTIKNLEFKLSTDTYEIKIPTHFLVLDSKEKNAYDDNGQRTDRVYYRLTVSNADVILKLLDLDEDITDLIDGGLRKFTIDLPLDYKPKDNLILGKSIVTFSGIKLYPQWVQGVGNTGGGYKNIRLEANSVELVELIDEE